MVEQILQFIYLPVEACADWFVMSLTNSGMIGIYLSGVFLYLSGRFILKPLFGSGRGSDKVKKSRVSGNE